MPNVPADHGGAPPGPGQGTESLAENFTLLADAIEECAADYEDADSLSAEDFTKLESEISTWQDDAADAYREMAFENVDITGLFGGTALAMGSAVRGAGELVTMVREFVRGFIADCIAKVVVWLAEIVFTAGLATPVVAAQLAAAVVKWVGRIFGWLMDLVTSIQSLRALLDV